MKTLGEFIPSRGRLHSTLKKCDQYGFYTTFEEKDNYANRVSSHINPNKNISLLQTSFDFCETMKDPALFPRVFSRMMCSYYIENTAWEKNLGMRIHDLMLEKKTIFIIIDLEQYLLAVNIKQYEAHSVSILLHPTTGTNYDMFYINSHGMCLFGDAKADAKAFSYGIITLTTRTRTKMNTVTLPLAPDFVMMCNFHKFLQKVVKQFDGPDFTIQYDMTERHNYLGCNFQSGDNHGICFVFPYIIWYYLTNYYSQSRTVGRITIPTIKTMLQQKNVNLFVISCFTELSKRFGNMVAEGNHWEELENYITEKQTHFLKQILCPFIEFLTQSCFVKQLTQSDI